jgi:hypothetical protein
LAEPRTLRSKLVAVDALQNPVDVVFSVPPSDSFDVLDLSKTFELSKSQQSQTHKFRLQLFLERQLYLELLQGVDAPQRQSALDHQQVLGFFDVSAFQISQSAVHRLYIEEDGARERHQVL